VSVLEATGLSKRFGGVQAVSNVTLSVDEGQIYAVIGPNGAGKTTLLNLLCGLQTPDEGSVRLSGRDITKAAPHVRAQSGMARTLQTPVVYPRLTVLENVMVGWLAQHRISFVASMLRLPSVRRWERDAKRQALETLDLLEMGEYADRQATELPAGLQRLVEIARALASQPKLLVLDEPAAGLARGEVSRLAALIRTAKASGIAVCLVEHNMPLIMSVADRILVIQQGAPLFEGTAAETRQDPRVIAAYLGQAKTEGGADALG
jgi:ABC-type branched-subunit amino acid transport system ATPase component